MNSSIWTLVEKWKNQIHKNPPIIIIYWPTACGKTAIFYRLEDAWFRNYQCRCQTNLSIYEYWNWKNTWRRKTRNSTPYDWYHRSNGRNIMQIFLRMEYYSWSRCIILEKYQLSVRINCTLIPLFSNLAQHDAPPNWERREELEIFRGKEWNIALWNFLHSIDPHYADILHPNNYRYVMRGIEVFESTWQSKLAFRDVRTTPYDLLHITWYDGDREKLYNRINSRIETMFQDWLIDEVQHLLLIYPKDSFWLRTIWYSEVIDYIDGIHSTHVRILLLNIIETMQNDKSPGINDMTRVQ